MLVVFDATLTQQLEGLAGGGLVVVVVPVICGVLWFVVIGGAAVTCKMLRKWLHKEHARPTTWYD